MNANEYYRWWQHAADAFPAIHRLFPPQSEESRRRSKLWQEALARVSVEYAMQAIDAMLSGKVEPPKYDWAELPRFVLQFAADQLNADMASTTEAYYDSPTVRCRYCQDSRSGFVTVWGPSFVAECDQELLECRSLADVQEVHRQWRHATQSGLRYRTVAVVCFCDSPAAVCKRKHGAANVLDPKQHAVVGSLRQLQEWMQDTSRFEWRAEDW